MDPSPHRIAHELLRQLAADEEFAADVLPLYGAAPVFYLDDDDPEDKAPHILATPDTSEEGIGTDGDIRIRLVVSAYATPEEDALAPDPESPGLLIKSSSATFDALARATWQAVKRTRPGAILQAHTAEWGFGDLYPLLFVTFTLEYRTIQAFGDQ